MFLNIYGKRVKCFIRNRDTIIWTWVFPIMMATLFFFTFSTMDTAGQLRTIPLGVVNGTAYRDANLISAMESASGDQGALFSLVTVADLNEADIQLEEGNIDGYVYVEERPVLVVADDGLNQTIIKAFLDRYVQTMGVIETALTSDPSAAANLPAVMGDVDYTNEISLSSNPPTDKVGYFYALLAMVCMYGGIQGLATVTYMQANLSPLGARRTVSPAGRFRTTVYDMLGGITVHFLCLVIVVLYIVYVLGVSFGSQLWMVLLTCLLGSMLGIAFGAMISVSSKLKETAKIAILISVTMVCCFLSGLMVSGINYTVAQQAPVVAWLNPAARIADAFYCLYYYDTYERFFINIGVIAAMTVVMFAVTAIFLRRQRYESI